MPTPVLNNGIYTRDTVYKMSSHVDSYHLKNMLGESKPTDLGPVDLWAMAQKVDMPLYKMASLNKQPIIVNSKNGEFTWQTPVVNDLPFIVEDIEDATNAYLGADGTFFRIKINKRAFGHTDIITYDKFNGQQWYVTTEDILPGGDGFIYTMQLVNNDSAKTVARQYLKPGTKLFSIGSAKSPEYGERYSDIGEVSAGFRSYYNFVGGAVANTSFSISSRADMMAKGGLTAEGTVPVMELWRVFDDTIKGDPSLTTIESVAKKLGKDFIKKGLEEGKLSRAFVTKMEAAHIAKIGRDVEMYLMWGTGGTVRNTEGMDSIRLGVGLWRQLDNSYCRIYNKNQFSLEMFRSEIFNYFNGKVDFTGPDPDRTIIIQTGHGGYRLISEAIQHDARGANMVMNAKELGAITGSGMDLGFGFAFTHFKIPFLANVRFELNPAFDPIHTNDIENPQVDGYPLSSYNFIVFDITETGSDNIRLLKYGYDQDLRWWYQNGTMDYMGRTSGFQSSGNFTGYRVFMEQTMPGIHVMDPTRVLKIVMKNPVTGGHM